MRLLFLGTGAAGGTPSVYCGCASCVAVRAAGPRLARPSLSLQRWFDGRGLAVRVVYDGLEVEA